VIDRSIDLTWSMVIAVEVHSRIGLSILNLVEGRKRNQFMVVFELLVVRGGNFIAYCILFLLKVRLLRAKLVASGATTC
jgi:hypothetical protein